MDTTKKIEVGKSYKLRNGLSTGPIRKANNGTNYVFEAEVKEPNHKTNSVFSWKKNGRYLTNEDHPKDIIL